MIAIIWTQKQKRLTKVYGSKGVDGHMLDNFNLLFYEKTTDQYLRLIHLNCPYLCMFWV